MNFFERELRRILRNTHYAKDTTYVGRNAYLQLGGQRQAKLFFNTKGTHNHFKALLPFWYICLTQTHYKKDVAEELETALSIITTGYLRGEDIVTAIEENVAYLHPPVQTVFSEFLTRVKLIDPDIEGALQEMRGKIQNEVFGEWCDAIAACQQDRSLKSTLTPIVAKLSDVRVVNGELENLVFEPRKEFIMMSMLVVGNVPLMYVLNKAWFHTLMYTTLGQLILALCGVAVFVCTAFVVKLTQPIEYRR